jgi:hypothetical protein
VEQLDAKIQAENSKLAEHLAVTDRTLYEQLTKKFTDENAILRGELFNKLKSEINKVLIN